MRRTVAALVASSLTVQQSLAVDLTSTLQEQDLQTDLQTDVQGVGEEMALTQTGVGRRRRRRGQIGYGFGVGGRMGNNNLMEKMAKSDDHRTKRIRQVYQTLQSRLNGSRRAKRRLNNLYRKTAITEEEKLARSDPVPEAPKVLSAIKIAQDEDKEEPEVTVVVTSESETESETETEDEAEIEADIESESESETETEGEGEGQGEGEAEAESESETETETEAEAEAKTETEVDADISAVTKSFTLSNIVAVKDDSESTGKTAEVEEETQEEESEESEEEESEEEESEGEESEEEEPEEREFNWRTDDVLTEKERATLSESKQRTLEKLRIRQYEKKMSPLEKVEWKRLRKNGERKGSDRLDNRLNTLEKFLVTNDEVKDYVRERIEEKEREQEEREKETKRLQELAREQREMFKDNPELLEKLRAENGIRVEKDEVEKVEVIETVTVETTDEDGNASMEVLTAEEFEERERQRKADRLKELESRVAERLARRGEKTASEYLTEVQENLEEIEKQKAIANGTYVEEGEADAVNSASE